MGKLSYDDKLRIQTLREHGLGAKAIIACYPDKGWKLSSFNKVCSRVDSTGSAVLRQPGSGRPATAITNQNVQHVEELICSQESNSGRLRTSALGRSLQNLTSVSRLSVCHIAKRKLHLKSFRRMPALVINDATRQKRLERARALLNRITVRKMKKVFFTDEKNFYLNPPINNQNNRVWSGRRKPDVEPRRLLVEMVKFAPHLMVSAGVCVGGKGRLNFVDEKAKVNAAYYLEKLLPKLVEDCEQLLPNNFIFHSSRTELQLTRHVSQDWLKTNCSDFIAKDEWPPNSPDQNPMDYHVWGGGQCWSLT